MLLNNQMNRYVDEQMQLDKQQLLDEKMHVRLRDFVYSRVFTTFLVWWVVGWSDGGWVY